MLQFTDEKPKPESREAYTTARRETHRFKRQSKTDAWNTLCEEMERGVVRTKQLIYQLAKSYRKGQQQHPFTIKVKDSDEIIAQPENGGLIMSRIYLMLRLEEIMR